MAKQEIHNIANFWVDRIKYLVNRINMAAIDDETEEIISVYHSTIKIQPESDDYARFNQQFIKLSNLIDENFIFDPIHNKNYRLLLPSLKINDYNKWVKLRFEIIDSANLLESELNKLIEKHIKAKISVSGVIPKYDIKRQSIFFGEHQIILERDSLEHAFCDVLFNQMKSGQSMSWDEFWEKMCGALEIAEQASMVQRKQIYDLHLRLNKKIKSKLKNKDAIISTWKNSNIIRNF